MKEEFRVPGDRTIDSTDTNEFANGLRDENMLAEDIVEDAIDGIPQDDEVADAVNEYMVEDRPLYDEMGIGQK